MEGSGLPATGWIRRRRGLVLHAGGGACWARGALTALLLGVAGCNSSSPLPTKEAPPAFVGSGKPAECPGRCIRSTVYVARAELGLDPRGLGEEIDGGPAEVFRALKRECTATGGTIRSVSVAKLLNELKEGTIPPTVLAHENGHLHLLLGALDIDGQLMCQLVHGGMPVSLISKAQLLRAGFQEAWQFEKQMEGVLIQVGSGRLRIDRVCHNFGEMKPDEELECAFALNNVGNVPLVLGNVRTSCTCTTTSALENTELGPAQTKDFGVTLRSTNQASQRHSVILTFFEKGTGVSRQAELLLFGSQRESMVVTLTKIDFGRVVPGKSYTRTVSIREVPTDRFVLKSVDLGELPIVHEVEVAKDKDGFATYRLHLELAVDEEWSGEHAEELSLTTDSHFQPKVTIPVLFRIEPPVRAIPSVISVGTVVVGEPREERVEFVSRCGEPVGVEIQSHPDECSITLDRQKNPLEMMVAIKLKKPGIWQDVITVNTQTPSGEEVIEIRCVGYGRESPD